MGLHGHSLHVFHELVKIELCFQAGALSPVIVVCEGGPFAFFLARLFVGLSRYLLLKLFVFGFLVVDLQPIIYVGILVVFFVFILAFSRASSSNISTPSIPSTPVTRSQEATEATILSIAELVVATITAFTILLSRSSSLAFLLLRLVFARVVDEVALSDILGHELLKSPEVLLAQVLPEFTVLS